MSIENITLTDSKSGTTAQVLAGRGFNCHSFRPVVHNEPVEVLWSEQDFAVGDKRPSRSGIPILFPFPGRIRGTSFNFGGQAFDLPAGDPRGNAIHGFVMSRPWRVVEQSPNRVSGQFQASVDDPAVLQHWPADFRITVDYVLEATRLRCQIHIENPDDKPLPFGFGTHPYFRVPLGARGRADACIVTVPTTAQWQLADMLPTGKLLQVAGEQSLAQGLPFAATQFDDVFTGLEFSGGRCVTSIADPVTKLLMTQTFDDGFRECVVFNPAHREAIAIEPYTCVPDPFALAERGVDSGLRTLAPGQSFRTQFEIELQEHSAAG